MKTHLTLKNQLSELNTLATAVESFAEQAGLDMKTQFNLNLALDELVTNIINYAYDDENLHQIEITLSYADSLLNIKIIDDGKPFDPTQADTPELAQNIEQREVGGLGIHFVRKLMDEMAYHRANKQNELTLVKDLSPQETK